MMVAIFVRCAFEVLVMMENSTDLTLVIEQLAVTAPRKTG